MKLHELSPVAGSVKESKRKGRGHGSGGVCGIILLKRFIDHHVATFFLVVVVFASAFDEESSELPQEANIALVSVSARAQAKNFFILITSV